MVKWVEKLVHIKTITVKEVGARAELGTLNIIYIFTFFLYKRMYLKEIEAEGGPKKGQFETVFSGGYKV